MTNQHTLTKENRRKNNYQEIIIIVKEALIFIIFIGLILLSYELIK